MCPYKTKIVYTRQLKLVPGYPVNCTCKLHESNFSLMRFIPLPPPAIFNCLPGPANLPSSCWASVLSGNDNKE